MTNIIKFIYFHHPPPRQQFRNSCLKPKVLFRWFIYRFINCALTEELIIVRHYHSYYFEVTSKEPPAESKNILATTIS